MERIVDIYGQRAYFDEMYQEEDSWFGTVLVKKDQTFEGVVEDYYQEQKYYVLGRVEGDHLDVYKIAGGDMQLPNHFEGTKDGRKYYGTVSVGNEFVEIPVGECQMSMRDAEVTRSETEYERAYLRNQINQVKAGLGEYGLALVNHIQMPKAIRMEPTK